MSRPKPLAKHIFLFLYSTVLLVDICAAQDTVRYFNNLNLHTNEELSSVIDLYQRYLTAKRKGKVNYEDFWIEGELREYNDPDLASHYLLPKENLAIMGVAKIDSNRYLLKTVELVMSMATNCSFGVKSIP